MKRFLLFAGETYYPWGGMQDFVTDFDTLNEAMSATPTRNWDWAHIYDVEQRRIVKVKSHTANGPHKGQYPEPYTVWTDDPHLPQQHKET